MLRLLARDDRERHGGQLAAHGEADVAPVGFRDAEVVPQPVGGRGARSSAFLTIARHSRVRHA